MPSDDVSPAKITSLADEVLLMILGEAKGGGRSLRASYLSYMLTCRKFLGPARSLLHSQVLLSTYDQAAGFLSAITSDSSLSPATRRLTLITSKDDRSLPSRSQAARILHLCYNIRDLTLVADEDESKMWRRSTVHSAPAEGAGLEALRSFKSTKIRYDRLEELLQDSPFVHSLDITGLYEKSKDEKAEVEEQDSDSEDGSSDNSAQTTRPPDVLASVLTDSADDPTSTKADPAPTIDSTPSSLPSAQPPPSLSLPLRSLHLDSAVISDGTTLGLCGGVSSTLTTLRLVHTATLTRQGLIDVLSMLPNLLTFELSGTLPQIRSGDPSTHLWPLDKLPELTPFLQWLKIDCDHAASTEILMKLSKLPLSCLTIGFSWPRLDTDAVRRMLDRIPFGRLDSLYVGTGLKWSASQLDEVRKCCESVGTMFGGEAYEPASFR